MYVEISSSATFLNSAGSCYPDCGYYWQYSGNPIVHSYTESQVELEWSESGLYTVLLYRADQYGDSLMDTFTAEAYNPRQIHYSYDESGNRLERSTIYVYKSELKSLGSSKKKEIPKETDFEQDIKLYPNPFQEAVYISLTSKYLEDSETILIIMDNMGRTIRQKTLSAPLNEIDASDLRSGAYVFRITSGSRFQQWIVIKK